MTGKHHLVTEKTPASIAAGGLGMRNISLFPPFGDPGFPACYPFSPPPFLLEELCCLGKRGIILVP